MVKTVPEERWGRWAENRQSWEAGGSAFDGQDPTRKTWGQAWHIAPKLHPAVAGVSGTGRQGAEKEEKGRGDSLRAQSIGKVPS